jgi:hypothetical protein
VQDPWQKEVAPVHVTPHPPQLWGSLYSFTHWPPQQAKPIVHPGLQVPPPLPELLVEPLPELVEPLLDPPLDPPLEPLLPSVDASVPPPVVVEPPHCEPTTASAPNAPIANGHRKRCPYDMDHLPPSTTARLSMRRETRPVAAASSLPDTPVGAGLLHPQAGNGTPCHTPCTQL